MIKTDQVKIPILTLKKRSEGADETERVAIEENLIKNKLSKMLSISPSDITKLVILRRSIDARDKADILYIYNLAFKGGYQYNRASAASMVMFVLIVISSAVLFYFLRDKDEVALERIKKEQIKAAKYRMKEEAARAKQAGLATSEGKEGE